jgi:hypothetical protein
MSAPLLKVEFDSTDDLVVTFETLVSVVPSPTRCLRRLRMRTTTKQSTSRRTTTVPPTLEAMVTTLTLVAACGYSDVPLKGNVDVIVVVVVMALQKLKSGIRAVISKRKQTARYLSNSSRRLLSKCIH